MKTKYYSANKVIELLIEQEIKKKMNESAFYMDVKYFHFENNGFKFSFDNQKVIVNGEPMKISVFFVLYCETKFTKEI